jgi:hypothetical protein
MAASCLQKMCQNATGVSEWRIKAQRGIVVVTRGGRLARLKTAGFTEGSWCRKTAWRWEFIANKLALAGVAKKLF